MNRAPRRAWTLSLPVGPALLLACAGEKTDLFDSSGPGFETDTSSPEAPAPPRPLGPEPQWRGAHDGYATGLAWADLDGDGDGDLVVALGNDMEPGPLAVYWNREGALDEGPTILDEERRYHGHLSAGDMNGDGLTDLAASIFLGDRGFSEAGGVQVWLNTGGAVSLAWETTGQHSFANALGDVDRDGDLDLAVAAGESYRNDPERSYVFLNDGRGDMGLEPAWTTPEDAYSFDAAFADFDGDGWLDLAFANQGAGHTLYLNDGAGALGVSPAWTAEGDDFEGNTLDWGDVNGDGALDLAVSDNDQLGGAGTFRLWCGPTMDLCWQAGDAQDYASALSLADADGDGDLDLATGAWWGAVWIYKNVEGALDTTAGWKGSPDDVVVEALAWEDVDGSDAVEEELTGEGLVVIPGRGRALAVEGGVAGDGYATGPGALRVRYLSSALPDLAVSDWEPAGHELLYGRTD